MVKICSRRGKALTRDYSCQVDSKRGGRLDESGLVTRHIEPLSGRVVSSDKSHRNVSSPVTIQSARRGQRN